MTNQDKKNDPNDQKAAPQKAAQTPRPTKKEALLTEKSKPGKQITSDPSSLK